MAIVDDQRLFVDRLVRILSIQPDVEVVGRAHTGEESVELCLREEPDVVLMDLSMPGDGWHQRDAKDSRFFAKNLNPGPDCPHR